MFTITELLIYGSEGKCKLVHPLALIILLLGCVLVIPLYTFSHNLVCM